MHRLKLAGMIFTLALITAVSGCCACCDFTPTPTPDGGHTPSGYVYGSYYQNDPGPSAEDVRLSSLTLANAAAALDAVDKAAFLACLTAEGKQAYGAGEMSGEGAKKLAAAIRGAEIARQYSDEIVYETEIEGETTYFSTTKEAGEWKLDGI